MSARHDNHVTPEQAEEYKQLVERVGKRFKAPGPQKQPAYKGIRQVAEALGIARKTLDSRMHGASNITTEQLLALRYLYDNPKTGSAVEQLPEPPRIPMTMREKILGVLNDHGHYGLTAPQITEILSTGNWRTHTTERTVQQRLYEMLGEEIPQVERVRRGWWTISKHGKNENI